MTKADVVAKVEYFNMVHGVTLRAIAVFEDQDLDSRPRPGMRTPKQLVFHIYAQEQILAEASRQGRFSAEAAGGSEPESEAVAEQLKTLATVRDVQAFAEERHQTALSIIQTMPEEDLAITAASFTPTFGCWGKNPRCCTTTN
jgi:hypothetical protein